MHHLDIGRCNPIKHPSTAARTLASNQCRSILHREAKNVRQIIKTALAQMPDNRGQAFYRKLVRPAPRINGSKSKWNQEESHPAAEAMRTKGSPDLMAARK